MERRHGTVVGAAFIFQFSLLTCFFLLSAHSSLIDFNKANYNFCHLLIAYPEIQFIFTLRFSKVYGEVNETA